MISHGSISLINIQWLHYDDDDDEADDNDDDDDS